MKKILLCCVIILKIEAHAQISGVLNSPVDSVEIDSAEMEVIAAVMREAVQRLEQNSTEGHSLISARLKALGAAKRDSQSDSISAMIKADLRKVLDADDAFNASFDDIPMSRVDAPDGKFRLFTWNVSHSNGTFLFEGFLLVKDKKRRVLYELRDMTEKIPTPALPQLTPENWYGALYYTVVPMKKGAKTYYTLLGWKGFTNVETRKVIEVLSFKGAVPAFGAPLFGEGRVKRMREVFGYSFQTTMSVKWDQPNMRIVLDHLGPMKPEFAGQAAFMGPDLSYDAYVWNRDHWEFQRDIDAREDGKSKPWNKPPKEER